MSVRDRLRRALRGGAHQRDDEAWERSRTRWRAAQPTANLTWGVEITGDSFIAKATEYGAFGQGRRVVEIGPGYGRLLSSALERGAEFGTWLGIDLSEENVAFLSETFDREGIAFVQTDIEAVRVPEPADAVLSSLTFKHLFPSFEAGLRNLAGQLNEGAVVVFDLIEGERRYFEDDGVTYIRWYSRDEIDGILSAAGLERVAFDEVQHHPELARLLVVARKPAPS